MVRYVHLPGAAVDTALLEDATRRGRFSPRLDLVIHGSYASLQRQPNKHRKHAETERQQFPASSHNGYAKSVFVHDASILDSATRA